MTRVTILLLACAALLSAGLQRVVVAQEFPDPPTIEELEQGIQRAEAEAQAQAEREAVARQRAQENRDRWRDITRMRSDVRSETVGLTRRGEAARLLHDLAERGRIWRVGMIWYYLGDDNNATSLAMRSLDEERNDWVVFEGQSQVSYWRAELLGDFNGEGWSDRVERAVTRRIEDAKSYLERSLAEPAQRRREQRARTYEQFNTWVDGYLASARRSAELLTQIEADTFNGDLMWTLANTYRDGLMNYMRALEWYNVIKRYFPDADRVQNGAVDGQIAETLVRMGLITEAQAYLQSAEEALGSQLTAAQQARDELLGRIERGELRREELTEEQRRIIRRGIQELREQLNQGISGSRERVTQYGNNVLRDAGREVD